MKAQHTPGPWNVQGRHAMEISGPPGTYIVANIGEAQTPNDPESYAIAQADALLIAAAPKMLAALETTLGNLRSLKGNAFKNLDTLDEWIAVVEAAIAEARGAR